MPRSSDVSLLKLLSTRCTLFPCNDTHFRARARRNARVGVFWARLSFPSSSCAGGHEGDTGPSCLHALESRRSVRPLDPFFSGATASRQRGAIHMRHPVARYLPISQRRKSSAARDPRPPLQLHSRPRTNPRPGGTFPPRTRSPPPPNHRPMIPRLVPINRCRYLRPRNLVTCLRRT